MKCVLFLLTFNSIALAQKPEPLTLLMHGMVWTGNPTQPQAQAVAFRGNRIEAVGSDEDILKLKEPGSHEYDLEGRLVLPGFNDAHVHMFSGGQSVSGPQLRYAKSAQEFRDTLAAFASSTPRGAWITGGEWDNENWTVTDFPARQLIDSVTRDWPVFVTRVDGHMSLANSAALTIAGIDANTKDVPGGVIVRDSKGIPTGILKDAAQDLVRKVIPPPTREQIVKALRSAQNYAMGQGVTSVQDMFVAPDVVRAYRAMEASGQLRVRVAIYVPLEQWREYSPAAGDGLLRIRGVKAFADGSLGSKTALFFEPYADAPGNFGMPGAALTDPERLYREIRDASAAGFQVAIHAIGDKANDEILGLYERLEREKPDAGPRLRIEHAQHLRPQDIPRFGRDGVIASMQPYHCIDDGRWAEGSIGEERAKTSYAWRSLLDSGAKLAFGSDWPVAPMSPLMGIYAAATRRTLDGVHPDGWISAQKISVEEAVRAYTSGSAYAGFDEQSKGTIEPGKLADLVVLDRNIFTIDPGEIKDAKVFAVVLNGKITSPPPWPYYKMMPSGLILRP